VPASTTYFLLHSLETLGAHLNAYLGTVAQHLEVRTGAAFGMAVFFSAAPLRYLFCGAVPSLVLLIHIESLAATNRPRYRFRCFLSGPGLAALLDSRWCGSLRNKLLAMRARCWLQLFVNWWGAPGAMCIVGRIPLWQQLEVRGPVTP